MRTRSARPRVVVAAGAALALALAGGALAGCSQIAALAPVGGDHLTEVRYAAVDVLVGAKVELLAAPACESAADGATSCAGETVAGETIAVDSPAADPTTVTVRVGDEVLYSGPIQDVLDAAARVGS